MGRYTVVYNRISILGYIWDPSAGLCAMTYAPTLDTVMGVPHPTREGVQDWLSKNTPDFREVVDFEADLGDWPLIPWADDESEFTFHDIMHPQLADDECGRFCQLPE